MLGLLNKACELYVDGTFKVVGKPFVRLWSIHAFFKSESGDSVKQEPLMFILISRRSKPDYVTVLQAVRNMRPSLQVKTFILDFEAAFRSAVRDARLEVSVKGCVFHWTQAAWTYVKGKGLAKSYKKNCNTHTSSSEESYVCPFCHMGTYI